MIMTTKIGMPKCAKKYKNLLYVIRIHFEIILWSEMFNA